MCRLQLSPVVGGGDPSGGGFKAALLSGPPGIGKTTSAVLVCKEAGFSYFEMNASDSRNKKTLQETVAQALDNTSLLDFMGREYTGRCLVVNCMSFVCLLR